MAKMKERTLLQKLTDVMPPYLANYLCWYYADPNTRCSWDELCSYDANFKQQGEHAGENKTEQFCEQNWLIRDDYLYATYENIQSDESISEYVAESTIW